jgi:hypothetical protein
MNESIDKAASGGDFYIWIVMFGILFVIVAFLAYKDRNSQR